MEPKFVEKSCKPPLVVSTRLCNRMSTIRKNRQAQANSAFVNPFLLRDPENVAKDGQEAIWMVVVLSRFVIHVKKAELPISQTRHLKTIIYFYA